MSASTPVQANLTPQPHAGPTHVYVDTKGSWYELLRRKSQKSLDAVLADAAGTPLAEFAASLRHDLAAVQAALDLPWTTSPAKS